MGSMEDVVSPVHHRSMGDVLTSASPSERANHISTIGVPTSGSQYGHGVEMKIRFTYPSSEDKHRSLEHLERRWVPRKTRTTKGVIDNGLIKAGWVHNTRHQNKIFLPLSTAVPQPYDFGNKSATMNKVPTSRQWGNDQWSVGGHRTRGRTSTGAIDEGCEMHMVSPEPFPNWLADAYCFESLGSMHMDEEQGHLLRRFRTAVRRWTLLLVSL